MAVAVLDDELRHIAFGRGRPGYGRNVRSALAALLLCALAGPLLTGCASPSEGAVTAAARSFVSSVHRGAGAAACRLLTPDARKATTGATDASCADTIGSVHERGESVTDVQVWGDTAQVRVGGDVLFLRRIAGRWLISAAGCKPQPAGPYDCTAGG